jgi:hypothetical protein
VDVSVLINVSAVAVSISAVATSAWLTRNQFKAQRHGNHVDPLIELLKEFRSLEFHQNYSFIRNELPKLPTDGGISGLNEDIQKKIYNVGYFFQLYTILVYLDVIDERFIGSLLHRRYIEAWTALEPFVHKEREIQGLPPGAILNLFEHFANYLQNNPPEGMEKMLSHWRPRRRRLAFIARRPKHDQKLPEAPTPSGRQISQVPSS